MSNLFISYSRDNATIVESLTADFRALGHTVWFDQQLSGGQTWWDQILDNVRSSDVFVIALGPSALESVACEREWKYAAAVEKPILPILVADNVATSLLPPALSAIQYVDYRRQDDRETVLLLARAMATLPSAGPLPDPLPDPPPVPLSYLGGLAERVSTSDPLTFEQQSALLFELKGSLSDAANAADARGLLAKLRKRRDVLATIAGEIDEVLAAAAPSAPDDEAVIRGLTMRMLGTTSKRDIRRLRHELEAHFSGRSSPAFLALKDDLMAAEAAESSEKKSPAPRSTTSRPKAARWFPGGWKVASAVAAVLIVGFIAVVGSLEPDPFMLDRSDLALTMVVDAMPPGNELAPGSSIDAELQSFNTYRGRILQAWDIPLDQPQQLTVTLESEGFDAYLVVQAPSGEVWTDDDSLGSGNSRVVVPGDGAGRARIVATSYSGSGTGPYRITIDSESAQVPFNAPPIELDDPTPVFEPPVFAEPIPLTRSDLLQPGALNDIPSSGELFGGTTYGQLTEFSEHRGILVNVWEIRIDAPQSLSVLLSSFDFDAFLVVETPSGQIYSDDDSGAELGFNSTDAQSFFFDGPGRVRVAVTSYDGTGTGEYFIVVSTDAPPLDGFLDEFLKQ